MKQKPDRLPKEYFYTAPSVIKKAPIFGMGNRPAWRLGNVIQAKVAKKYSLNVMLAQQSAREIERTGRTFKDVLDSAIESAFEAHLTIPWGADGDHLRNEQELKKAVDAGYTHFTYDVSNELKVSKEEVLDKVVRMYHLTKDLKKDKLFTTEISLDEASMVTKLDDLTFLLGELQDRKIQIDEIAPHFPGHFEKGIDYYYRKKDDKITDKFREYLEKVIFVLNQFNCRISIHSGSDKFSLYPIIADVAKGNFHLKTAGTYYLEDLKIVAGHDRNLFNEIYRFALEQFQKDRATYELSTDVNNIPDISKLASNSEISSLLESGSGLDDLRQILHVTYGSVLKTKKFADKIFLILNQNKKEHYEVLSRHINRHIELLGLKKYY